MLLRRVLAGCLLFSTCLLSACASTTHLQSSWRDASDAPDQPKKVAVFFVAKDENLARMAENEAAQRMTVPLVMKVEPGHQLNLEPKLEKETVRQELTKRGFDGAIVSRLVSSDTQETLVPAQPRYIGDPYYWGWWPRYRRGIYPSPIFAPSWWYDPPYVQKITRTVVETQFFRLPSGKPVWTGVSESVNTPSSAQFVSELVGLVIKELAKYGLMPPE